MSQKSVTKDQLMQEYNSVVSETEQLSQISRPGRWSARTSTRERRASPVPRKSASGAAGHRGALAPPRPPTNQGQSLRSVGAAAAIGAGFVVALLITRR
jgi:hypothetical protein